MDETTNAPSLASWAGLANEHGNTADQRESMPESKAHSVPPQGHEERKPSLAVDAELFAVVGNRRAASRPRRASAPINMVNPAWEGVSARIANDYAFAPSISPSKARRETQRARAKTEVECAESPVLSAEIGQLAAEALAAARLHESANRPAMSRASKPTGGSAQVQPSWMVPKPSQLLAPKWAGVSAQLESEWLSSPDSVSADLTIEYSTEAERNVSYETNEDVLAAAAYAKRPPGAKPSVELRKWGGIASEMLDSYSVPSPSPKSLRMLRRSSSKENAQKPNSPQEPPAAITSEEYVEMHSHAKPEVHLQPQGVSAFFDFSPLSSGISV